MAAVDGSEKVFALSGGIFYSVLWALVVTVNIWGFNTEICWDYIQGNASLMHMHHR